MDVWRDHSGQKGSTAVAKRQGTVLTGLATEPPGLELRVGQDKGCICKVQLGQMVGVLHVIVGRTWKVLTAGRAKKETPIKEKVAAIRRPSHVLGVLSP